MNRAETAPIKISIIGKLNKQGFTLVELIVVIALIGVMLGLAAPTTRDALTVNTLKKASRQLIGLERSLRTEAMQNQVDYILHLDIPGSSYYVTETGMTPEKIDHLRKNAKKLPEGVTIADIVNEKNEKVKDGVVKVTFGKNSIGRPLVIHLRGEEERMTLVFNPFLGVTAVQNRYVDISTTDGLGKDAAK